MIKKILKKYNTIPIAAKATLWFMFCSIIQKCISLISTPIFTRMMTKDQYGQFSVYNSWLQIFTIITTLRLSWAVFNKGMSKYKDDRDNYVSTMQTFTLLTACILLIIYLIFHNAINNLTELPTFIMVSMFAELMVTPAIDFWTIKKRYEYIYKPVVFRTLLLAILNTLIGVIAVLIANEKGYARILVCIIVNFCFGVTLFVYNRKKATTWFKKEYAVFALKFNLPLLLHYLSQYILDQFDRIMIQKMVSIGAAALYSVAYNAGLLMKIVTQSINNALIPWQYDKLEKKQFKELDDVLYIVFILVSACGVIFSACAPELMRILAGQKYYEAVYVIPPVALGMVFSFMFTTFANTEFFYNQNKFTMYISMGGALLNILLNYIGIKLFGYIAAAYTTLICYVIFAFSHYVYMTASVKKALKVDNVFNSKRLIILSVIVLAAGIFVIFIYDYVIIRYSIIVVVTAVMILNRKKIFSMFKQIKAIKK